MRQLPNLEVVDGRSHWVSNKRTYFSLAIDQKGQVAFLSDFDTEKYSGGQTALKREDCEMKSAPWQVSIGIGCSL